MSPGSGAVERAGAKQAEHIIAKAVERAGVREAEVVGAKEAERAGADTVDKTLTTDATRAAIDPHTRLGPDVVDHSRPGGDLIPQDYDRFGALSKDEFLDKHWDADHVNSWDDTTGSWRYPDNDGFTGTPLVDEPPAGTRFDRFGGESGDFVADEGTPFGDRALPPDSLGKDYHLYETTKPFDDASGYPTVGSTAPAFEQPGGGIQYKLPRSVQWLREHGYIQEVAP